MRTTGLYYFDATICTFGRKRIFQFTGLKTQNGKKKELKAETANMKSF